MDLTGETIIAAPRDRVWRALNDPEILRQAIPGCESINKLSDTELSAKVTAKIGPVKASFTGQVTLLDLDPPNGYRIQGEGKGGPAGFAKGGATVKLEDVPGGTRLSYVVDAQIGGKLAQIGSRLIDGAAKSLAAEFFQKFNTLVSADSAPAPDAEEAAEMAADSADMLEDIPPPPAETASPATADEAKALDEIAEAVDQETKALAPWLWISGLLLILAGLLVAVVA